MASIEGAKRPDSPGRSDRENLIEALTALVAALDQRVPHIERAGEFQIARDAEALRAEAQARLALLRATAG
jgi:hypothetical protein